MSWFYNKKSHGKGPMDGIGGTMNVVFQKIKSGFLTIDSPFKFYQAVKKMFLPLNVSVYRMKTFPKNQKTWNRNPYR